MDKHKYFFRGVGITLIITASIFYLVGLNITKKTPEVIGNDEIISRAKELGMIDKEQIEVKKEVLTDKEIIDRATTLGMIFKENDDKKNETDNLIEKDNTKENDIDQKTQEDIENVEEELPERERDSVTIQIKYGMGSGQVAKLLYDNKVVDNAKAFDNYLMKNKLAHKIKTGTYELKVNSSYEEVMKIFTN